MLFSKLTTSAFVLFMCTNLNAQGCADLVLDAGVDTSICGGQNYALGGTPSAQWVGSGNPTLNYNWYNSANTLLASVSNPVVAISQADTYMLVVDDGAGCSDTAYVTISDLPSPIADSLGMTGNTFGNYQTLLYNGELVYRVCFSNSNFIGNGDFTFTDPNLLNYPIGTTMTCDWGDGNLDTYTYSGAPINMIHIYPPGDYDFTYSVTYPSGCSSQVDFNVFVGISPPALSVSGSGNAFCLPQFYQINIGAPYDPTGTVYNIQINDGTDTSFVGLPSNPFTFQHLFATTSCGVNTLINNSTYQDSYSIQVTSSNGCNLQGTFAAIGPIQVGESTDADFVQSSGEVCVGGEVIFNNTSETGSNVYQAGGCDTSTALYWEVTPSSGFTVSNGVLGANNGFDYFQAWSSGTDQLNLQFDSTGVYDITLYIGNECGIDSLTQQVCVLPQPTANFDLSNDSFCTSELVSTTNNSAGLACGFQFESDWQVTYENPLNCSPNSGVNFVNSTDTTSFEPVLDFIGPGNYEITLTTAYPGSIPGCLSDQMVDSVFVQSPPEIQLVPLGDSICEGEDVQFTGSVVDCYDSSTIYTWYFEVEPGILIFNSSTLTPNVTYNSSGTFTYSLEATNICGNNVIMDSIVVNPDVFVDAGTNQAACLNTILDLNGVISGGTTSGVWSANVSGGFFDDPNALITTYTPPINFSGQITITLTSIDPVGPCLSNSDSFIYTISDEAVVDAMPDATVCEGDLVTLNASLQGAASTATWSDNGAGGQIINENQSSGFAQYILPSGVNQVVLFVETDVPSPLCPSDIDSVVITILDLPTISPLSDQTVCDGSTTQAVVFNGTGTQYSWTNSDPSIGLASSGFGDIAPFTAQNGGQSAVNALITVTPQYISGGVTCSGSSEDFTITVNPLPTIDTISDQTFCEGDQTLSIDFTSPLGTTFTWTNDNTQTGLGASGSGSIPSFTTTNGTTQPVISLITVTPTLNGCIGPDMTFTLTVNPVPVVDALPSIDTCSGTLLSISFTGTATQYNWTNDNTTIGLGASGTGTIDFTTINVGTSSELATVAVTPGYLLNNLLCPGSIETFTITVQPVPHVLPLQDQTICNGDQTQLVSFGSDVLGTSYTWTNDNSQIGLSSTGSQDIPSFTGTNSGNTSIVGTVTVSPFANGCPGPDSTLQFTIDPTPVITTSQLSDTLCSTDSSTPVAWTSNVIGTSYTWTGVVTSGAVSGVVLNGTGDLPSMQLTNTGSVPAVIAYTVTPEANGCSGGSITYTIVVNPIPSLSPIAAEVICGGTSFTAPVFTSTVSGTSYTWTLDQPGNVPATLTGYQLSGSGALPSQTINNSGNSPYTLDYIVTPTADGCIGLSEVFSLTINPAPVVSFSLPSQVICSGDVSSQVVLSSFTPNVTFDWIASSVPAGVSGVSPLQDTSNIPSMTLTNSGVSPEVVTFIATATTSGGAACPGSPTNYTITINPVPSVSTVTDQTVCDGSTTQAVVFNGTGTQYSWTNSDPSIGLASSGFGDIAPFTAQNGGQSAVNALITVTPEYTSGGVTCSGSPFTFSFTVDPTPFVNPVVDQELCIGDLSQPITFTGTASNYNWTNTNTASGAAGSGVGIVNSFVAQNNTNQVLTSSFEVIPEANGCIGSSIFFVIDVNPETSVSPIGSMEFCSGDQTSIVSFSGGGLSYSWTNDTPSIGLPASGVGPIASFTATNGTNVPLQATITVTPLFVGGLTSCPGSSTQFTITVNPIPTVLPVADQVICNGSSSQAVQFSGTNASAFQWTASSTSIGIPASGTGTIQSFTTVNSGSNSEISNVVVTPELASNGLVCFGSPESFDFIINPSPSVTAISDILVCEGETVPSTLIAGNATSFDWTSAPSNTGVQTSGSGNIPSFVATNSTNQPISDVMTITPNFSGSGLSCPGVPLSFTVTVNPLPEVDPLSDQVLCSGSSTSPVLFNGTATNYAWTNSAPSIGLLSSGNGDISSFTAGNLGQSEVVSIFEVTPEYTAGGLTCIGNQELFTITVNPTPIIDPLSDLASCSGDDIGPIIFTGISTSFNWTNTNTGIGIQSSGTGNIGIVNYSNTGAVTENTTITVTPEYTFAGLTCIGSSESFSIGVLPNPTINSIPDYTYCNNESTVPVNFSGLATEFTWTNTNPQIGLASNGVGDISSFTVINGGGAVETASVSITPGYTDIGITCQGTPQLFNITVNPAPTINSVPDLIVCNGDQVSAINFSGTATNFSWSNSEPSIGLLNSGNGNISSFSAINTGITPVTATITVESSFGSNGVQCTGITESFTITVNPTPTVDPIADQVVCDGASTNTVTLTGSGTSYTWTNTLPSIGISSNGTGDIPAFSALNTSSLPVTANFTVVPVALQCSGTAELFSLTVNPTPTVDPIASIEGCIGVVQPVIQPTGNFSSISWTNSNATIGIPSFGTAQIPSFTLSNPSNATVNQSVVIFTPINTNAGVQCLGLQTQFDISVNPSPEADPIADIELCNGESSSIVSLTGSGSFYEWTNSNPSIGLAGAGNGDVPVFNATNTQNSDTTALISVTPIYQSSSGQLCSGTGTDFNFIVHPSPLIDTVGIATVCSGDDLNVNLSASVPSLISWSAIDNPDVLGESTFLQTLPTINNTLTNNVATIESVTYEVSANSLPYGCVGPTYSFDALVIPEVFITSSPTIEICSGVSASVFLTTNIPSDFIWFATDNPNVIGESQVFGTGNIINDVLINTSLTPQIVVYSVIPTSQQGACQGLAQTVSVLVNPPIELISPLSSEICSGDVVDMNLVANANVNFSWFAQSSLEVNGESLTIQNGSVIDDQLENTTLVPQSVFYTVVATTQANGCSSPSTQVEVVVNPVPVVDPLNVVLCSGETVNAGLTASSTSSFEWYADPNNNVTGETQIPQNTSLINDQLINSGVVAETVLYSIQATSDKGCVGPILVQPVLVNPLPEVDFIISNQILCEIDSIYFVNNSNPAYSFLWDFGDGDMSSVFEPSHIYGATGNYTVTLTAVDPQTNCINIDESNVLIQDSPPVDFVVNQTEGCIPANFVFTDLNNLPDVDVVWDFGDGQLSNQPGSIDHTYADTGCFTVTLTATNAIGCVSTFSNTDMVCVYENPIAFFTAEETIVPADDPFVYFINNSQYADTYVWDFGDGATSFSENPVHLYPEGAANYEVLLTASNASGCFDQFVLTIVLWEEELIYVPNSFTPNGDGSNDIFKPIITAGFDKESYQLLIFNRWGEMVFESYDPNVGWDGTFGTSQSFESQDGTYTWRITLRGLQDEDATLFLGHVNLLK